MINKDHLTGEEMARDQQPYELPKHRIVFLEYQLKALFLFILAKP